MEYRILSNGNPVSSDKHLLLNKLTGDDAASGFGVALYSYTYTNSWSYVPFIIDALPGTNFVNVQYNSMEPDTGQWIYLYLEPDGTSLRNGKFEATATINVDYY